MPDNSYEPIHFAEPIRRRQDYQDDYKMELLGTTSFTLTTDHIHIGSTEDDILAFAGVGNMSLNSTYVTGMDDVLPRPTAPFSELSGEATIPLYALIFLLSVVGNSLVIVTLVQNKRMRTVTNVLLLNLAVSDLLLGMFCMPFTLVGTLLREFIFGEALCRIIPFLQAVSVSVSVWTLMAISMERYFAICQPLRSRRWQTLSHAYKMIAAVWIASVLIMLPIAILSQLLPMKNSSGRYKCRENWPDHKLEKAFNIFLDVVLLLVPLFVMVAAYYKIMWCLWQGIRMETQSKKAAQAESRNEVPLSSTSGGRPGPHTPSIFKFGGSVRVNVKYNSASYGATSRGAKGTPATLEISGQNEGEPGTCVTPPPAGQVPFYFSTNGSLENTSGSTNDQQRMEATGFSRQRIPMRHIRSTKNLDKSLAAKKHVILMLFMVVLEFFICWTPLYVIHTISLFDPRTVYGGLGYTGIALIHLLAYISSCCNPITYCFMNKKFRQGFLQAFNCKPRLRRAGTQSSTNGASFYNPRSSTIRTVVEYPESETQL